MGEAYRLAGLRRRLASSLLSLVLLVTISFALIHVTPGGPAFSILNIRAPADQVARINALFGLTTPLWKQYLLWWGHLLRGELGYSYMLHRPVGALLVTYALNTLVLYTVSITIAVLLSVAIGMLHGAIYLRASGRTLGLAELALSATPNLLIAAMLVLLFSNALGWLPSSGMTDLRLAHLEIGSYADHLVLPVMTVTLGAFGVFARYFGQAVHDELGQDYVRSGRARGASMSRVLFGHVLRNALRPLVTLLGLSFPAILVGSATTESVFAYPGLGWLLWRSALLRDYPVMVAIVLLVGIATTIGNLAADLINSALDRRSYLA